MFHAIGKCNNQHRRKIRSETNYLCRTGAFRAYEFSGYPESGVETWSVIARTLPLRAPEKTSRNHDRILGQYAMFLFERELLATYRWSPYRKDGIETLLSISGAIAFYFLKNNTQSSIQTGNCDRNPLASSKKTIGLYPPALYIQSEQKKRFYS